MTQDSPRSSLVSTLGHIHLIYLGLLPALATFAVLYLYGNPAALLLFLGGTAGVGVYLAVSVSYARPPVSVGWALLVLLDGPAWAILSLFSKESTPLAFAVEGFLVDGTAIWISILILALHSYKPTTGQRVATVGFMVVSLGAAFFLIWPYYRNHLQGEWLSVGLLVIGVVEAAIVQSRLLKKDEVVRDTDTTSVYIVVFIFAWIIAMIVGNVLHWKRTKRQSAAVFTNIGVQVEVIHTGGERIQPKPSSEAGWRNTQETLPGVRS